MTLTIRFHSIIKTAAAVTLLIPLVLAAGCSSDSVSPDDYADSAPANKADITLSTPNNPGYDPLIWTASKGDKILGRAHGKAPDTQSLTVEGKSLTAGNRAHLVMAGRCESGVSMVVTVNAANSSDTAVWQLSCDGGNEGQTIMFDPQTTHYETIDIVVSGTGKWAFIYSETLDVPQSE